MARQTLVSLKLDTTELDDLVQRLGHLSNEDLGAAMVEAVNETTRATYELGRKTMLSGINLQDAYLLRRMQVDLATTSAPKATITALGGRGFTTGLSHYSVQQLTKPARSKLYRLKGYPKLGIPAGSKTDGVSVEVVGGSRKRMGSVFAMTKFTDADGNFVLFSRDKLGKIKSKKGLSVYQLFSAAIPKIKDQTMDDLEKSVVKEAESAMMKVLS